MLGTPAVRAAGPDGLPLALRSVGLSLLALYFLLLAWVTLRQVPTAWAYDANLTPFASVHRALATGGAAGLRQVAGELALLAPLGVLLPVAGGRPRAAWLPSFLQTLGGTALIATAVEVLRTGVAGHVLNVDDILLGVIGAATAHLLVVPAGRAWLRTREAREPAAVPARPEPAAAEGAEAAPRSSGGTPTAAGSEARRERVGDILGTRAHHPRVHRPGQFTAGHHRGAPSARAHRR
ncbi:VanZ family protein [Kitasatospora sp. NBC_01287]|uniref:VanZ family protein n=1 Tax=Kitasatospora sp. NBC_01287 TaxID=2903573 RepID=UPI0022567DBE|nr:VanZ family protein [Kitasatospora sp. NBC_01287]MCX4748613.1 VanZ family protein [Kitasatospora sp. NBC_01287]